MERLIFLNDWPFLFSSGNHLFTHSKMNADHPKVRERISIQQNETYEFMKTCEFIKECQFLNVILKDMPGTSGAIKKLYCQCNAASCARYNVASALGEENVPNDCIPFQLWESFIHPPQDEGCPSQDEGCLFKSEGKNIHKSN
ncbi:hypothetical protein ACFLYW_01485 [Thermodesulfobacteriota bacterium]